MRDQSGQRHDQSSTDAFSARLIQLVHSPLETPEKATVRAWAQTKIPELAGAPIAQFPFEAVVAFILSHLERLAEALAVSLLSIQKHGRDELGDKAINHVRSRLLRQAFDAVEAKRSDLARAQLLRMIEVLDGAATTIEERSGLDLLSAIAAIKGSRAAVQLVEGRPTVAKLGIWGDSFVESAARNVLASCLAPGNAPALARFGKLIIHLHTRERHVEQLRSLPAVRELLRYAEIKIELIPENLFIPSHMWGMGFWNRCLLAMVEYDSLMYARQIGADMVCLGADMVLSDGCLKAAKDKLAAGYDIFLMSPALRMIDEKAAPLIQRYRRGSELVVPADALYRLALETLHPGTFLQFMRRDPQRLAADPHQFFFTTTDGFAAHTFQWHPLAFSARSVTEDIGFDGHTIDCRFSSDLLAGKDRIRASYVYQDPPRDGYVVTVDSMRNVAEFGDFEMSPRGAVRSIEKWINREEDFDHFEWALRQRTEFRVPPGVRLVLPTDCPDEDKAIETIIAGVKNLRPVISRRIKGYAEAPRVPYS